MIGIEQLTAMAELLNPRHEQFCQLISAGHSPARAYVAVGYSEKSAYTSGPRLLKTPAISGRVAELQQLVVQSTVNRAAIDRDWVLSGLRRVAENGASESARVRALELVGKELGMFVERPAVPWDGDFATLTTTQLEKVFHQMAELAYAGDQEAIEEAKREFLGAPAVKTVKAQFEQVAQEAHDRSQSNPTQAANQLVPASSVGWRRSS
jgi:phage terminase small subunit